MLGSVPFQEVSRSRVQILEVVSYSNINFLEKRGVLYFFVKFMATFHKYEEDQTERPDKATHL